MSDELISFASIAVKNINECIEAKINKTAVTMIPVYVTKEEYEEANSIEYSTIADLKIMIFKIIDTLNKDDASIQQEIYNKSIKGKKKEKYVEYFYSLCELAETANSGELDRNDYGL